MAEPYVGDLFVGRAVSLANILGWSHDESPAQCVLSVVGPPGVGKSYLLHRVHELLLQEGRLAFWINLSRAVNIRGACPDVVSDGGLRAWLVDAIQHSRERCERVRSYDSSISPEAMLYTLATDLCERCDLDPILIVDGFEEIDERLRDWLEESVLAQFIARSCTRIIIGRRDEYSLNSPTLRWTETKEALPVMESDESTSQLTTRLTRWTSRPQYVPQTNLLPPSPDLVGTLGLQNAIPPYAWNHPGINTFLLDRVVPRHQAGLDARLTADDLHRCVIEVTCASEALSAAVLERLITIAMNLPEKWVSDDLMDKVKIVIEDALLAELFRRGIVFNIDGTAQYTVAAGIRELVQAWQKKASTSLGAQES